MYIKPERNITPLFYTVEIQHIDTLLHLATVAAAATTTANSINLVFM